MRVLLPGKPNARLQAVSTVYWNGGRIIAYITGNAFVILGAANEILQTIYDDEVDSLNAIVVDEATGHIATCSGCEVKVYRPYGIGEAELKWSLKHSFTTAASVSTLSWGLAEELLVGNQSLTLYTTTTGQDPEVIWTKSVANTVHIAEFSYDSACIASIGSHDRFVKIWRRLSFGSEETHFEFSYLPHPSAVTGLQWRKPHHVEQTIDNVLYTICADGKVRIWAGTDPHSLQVLQLWGEIDLQESIAPRSIAGEVSRLRFMFMINGRDFMAATEQAVASKLEDGNERDDHALEHLIEVANRSPEICVVLDELGHMSAWGLENVGCKVRQTTNIFNIAHVDGLNFGLPTEYTENESHVEFYNFCNKGVRGLNILVHHFDGRIELWECNVAELFDSMPRKNRSVLKTVWTGHSTSIRKIVRDISGGAVVSRTDDNHAILWQQSNSHAGASVDRRSTINVQDHIHRVCVMRQGQFLVFLHENRITLWDTQSPQAQMIASSEFKIEGKPLCILILPGTTKGGLLTHVATITSKMKGIVWEIQLPPPQDKTQRNGYHKSSIREFCHFDLGEADDLSYVLPVDPAGSSPVIAGFLDTFARDVAISYTRLGVLTSWTTKLDLPAAKVDWLRTSSIETGISDPALASGSSIRKAALVDSTKTKLTIWDVRGAQLEYSEDYGPHDAVQDLDWTSTPDDQSVLAVGFRFKVVLLAQLRYDYMNKGAAWASIREINIRDLTPHPIGDSTWLGDGNLIIGAGNQLFVYDKGLDPMIPALSGMGLPHRKKAWDLFDVVSRLNGPLPVYHPQFLGQCTLAGKMALVQEVLLRLWKTLKYSVDGEAIDSYLGMEVEDFYVAKAVTSTAATSRVTRAFGPLTDQDDEDDATLTETVAASLKDKLTQISLPQLSRQEQIQLADIVECIAIVEKQRRSMDANAAKFMLSFRQHLLRRGRSSGVLLSWREINWAHHSNSQDILADMVSSQFHGKMLWEHARECGLFMWMSDSVALKRHFENIARNEYTKSDLKNPVDCSLYYLALRKKTVLQGLWRMAAWNREQSATIRLLQNNFSDKKWKTAAMKNAYALLGKHRNEYAAAFFLLADCLRDAVNVIINQLKDVQLAIAVTRVYEGEDGPVLKELLQEKVLPLAAQEGNRWLASWVFWMLRRRDMAVRALISPVYTLLETPSTPPDLQSKSFLTDDPALVVLYSQLRAKTLQTLKGATKVTPGVEWNFVLHNARLYDRMGCDLLALDLVRNWEFLLPTPTLSSLPDKESDPRSLLRRRQSQVVADLPVEDILADIKINSLAKGGSDKNPHKPPPPQVFIEPESSSLLDSFGF